MMKITECETQHDVEAVVKERLHAGWKEQEEQEAEEARQLDREVFEGKPGATDNIVGVLRDWQR